MAKANEEEVFLATKSESTADSEMSAQNDYDHLKEDHDFEKMTAAQYAFVKKRMQKDLISTQIQTSELRESLK